jgi:hypothetical protein
MGVIASLVIFAADAIMRFAVTATSPDFNVKTVGAILMIVGAVGFVISLLAWGTWGGLGTFRRERHIVRRGTVGPQPPSMTGAPGYEEEEYHRVS